MKIIKHLLVLAISMLFYLPGLHQAATCQTSTAKSSIDFYAGYYHMVTENQVLVIDGRTAEMYASGHLENAINIDADGPNLISLLKEHRNEPLIVVYCTTMRRTNKIVNALKDFYEGDIIYISDGIQGWQQNALPLSGISRMKLQQIVDEVLENNDRLRASGMMIESARAGMDESASLYKPFVDANFQYAYLDIVPGFKRERLGNIEHTLFPFVSASMIVYSGGRLQHQMEAAEITYEQEKAGLGQDIMDVKLAVYLNYYRLASAINQKNIILQSLKHLNDQEQYTRLMIQAGRMSELESYRISVERNALRGMLLQQDNTIAAFSHELCALMGRNDLELFFPADSLRLDDLGVEYQQLMATALEYNPYWQQLELRMIQEETQVKLRQSEKMPRVSAQIWAGYEFGLQQFSFIDNSRYFAGLTATVPIFDGGMIAARTQKAQARVESTRWTKESFRKMLGSQLENLYRRMEEMRNQVTIQNQSVEQGRQSFRLAMIEYQAGRRSNTDLLDIQQSLIKSELQLNEAVVNYNISKAQLLYAIGLL